MRQLLKYLFIKFLEVRFKIRFNQNASGKVDQHGCQTVEKINLTLVLSDK